MANSHANSQNKVPMRVMGISYSQVRSGAYALILAQKDGPYRIPIVVGAPEAQSIAIKMEGIIPPRPMTHDLFASLCHAFALELTEVYIHKFEDGIFLSEMTFINQNGEQVVLDARTSDAIAIAMRTGTPIFTTPEIIDEAGFILEIQEVSPHDHIEEPQPENDYDNKTLEELNEMLAALIEQEQYEQAARLKEIIDKKKNS